MDEMQILVPVAVKSKLTEQLKATLLAEIEQNLKRVDHDMSQLDFEANGKLAEQAKINVQAVAPPSCSVRGSEGPDAADEG